MEPATTFVWAEMLADRKFFAEVVVEAARRPDGRVRPERTAAAMGARRPRRVRDHGPDARLRGRVEPARPARGSHPSRDQPVGARVARGQGLHAAGWRSRAPRGAGDHQPDLGTESGRPPDRQRPDADRPVYATFPLAFTARADTSDGRLEIVGTGTGTFRIGVVSLMPADNVSGFKAASIKYLKELGIGIARWPAAELRLRLRLARRHRRSRQAAAPTRVGVERDGIERHGHRRLHDVLPSHRRGALPCGELRARRRALGGGGGSNT